MFYYVLFIIYVIIYEVKLFRRMKKVMEQVVAIAMPYYLANVT